MESQDIFTMRVETVDIEEQVIKMMMFIVYDHKQLPGAASAFDWN